MMTNTVRNLWAFLPVAVVLFATLAPSNMALAQESDAIVLDEITVTAQRRQVDIQDAALAVSVLSGEDFDRSNVIKLDHFNGYLPGLTVAKNDGGGQGSVVAIRGVGWESAQNLSTQPSVLMYIDGVFIANPNSYGTHLGDLERIEVFRGPQGTEFGQGTTGGAINLVTKKPQLDDFGGEVSLGFGTYSTVHARGALNIPVGDNSAIRASAQKYTRDGFAEITRAGFTLPGGNAPDGYELDDADSWTAKLSWLWEPNDDWSVYLSAFLQDSDQNAAATRHVDDPHPDKRKLTQDFPGTFELENNAYTAVIEWETPGGAVLKSTTGYQELEKRQTVDSDRLNEELIAVDIFGFFVSTNNWGVLPYWDNESDAFSQELSLTYSGDAVDWVFGAYYLDHENFDNFLEATAGSPFSDWEDELANPGPMTLPPFVSALNFVQTRTVTHENWAVFGQVGFSLGDRVTLRAGGRYQDDDLLDLAIQNWTCFGAIPCPTQLTLQDSEFTWKLGIDFDVTEENLLYGLISTGWKIGGTNPGALVGTTQLPLIYQPAEVTSFEIGSKNLLNDGRARFNVVGFYYDYENLQFMQEDSIPFASGTGNIPEMDVYGIETEFNVLLSDTWQLDGHLTWMDGEFKTDFFTMDIVDFREGLVPGVVGLFTPAGQALRDMLAQTTNLRGNTPPKLVEFSARLALTNDYTFSGGSVLTSRLEYIHRGEYQYRVWNNPLVDTVPSYDIFNLYFNYGPDGGPWSVSVGLTNVTDEDGVNSRFSNPFGVLQTSEEFIPPFEAIATIRFEF